MRTTALVLFFASACTGSITSGPGGGDDQPPPSSSKVQITVRDNATAQANVRVLFQTSDGTTITEAATDASGVASADMPAGGNLTVIRTYPVATDPAQQKYPEVFTYLGVKPGDQLQLGHMVDDSGTAAAINVKVPDTAQGTVKVVTPCGSGTGTAPNVAISVAGCASQIAIYVSDGGQNSFVAHAAYGNSIDLSTNSLVGNLSSSLSSINVTTGVTSVTAEARIVDGGYQLFSSGTKTVTTNPATVNMPNLSNVDELVIGTIATTAGGTQMIASRRPYQVTPTAIDASANLIAAIDKAPTATPTAVTWLESGTGTADFVIATVDVTRGSGNTLPSDAQYTRTIIAPHAGATLAIPVLDGADATYNPVMKDQLSARVGLVQATGGYDAMRARAFSVTNIVDSTPMSGTVTLSYAGGNPPEL